MTRSWRSDLLPFSRIHPCSRTPTANSSNTAAVERYLACACIAKSSTRIYRVSPTAWGWTLTGEPAPTGPARRGAKPPLFPVAAINDPAPPEVLAELAAARADEMDADTVNRELSIARKAIGWWQRQGWIECDPTLGIERRPATPDHTHGPASTRSPGTSPDIRRTVSAGRRRPPSIPIYRRQIPLTVLTAERLTFSRQTTRRDANSSSAP